MWDFETCGGMCFLALSNVHKVALPLAAHSLCKQVPVVNVFAQHSHHWKTQEAAHNISPGDSTWNCISVTDELYRIRFSSKSFIHEKAHSMEKTLTKNITFNL